MPLSEAVRTLRAHLGLSQEKLARRLDVSTAALIKYEAGREPTSKALAALAHVAAEAGRHDLAYLFARHLVRELGLERLQVGIFSAPAAPKEDSPGVMVVTFRSPEARDYARAFFETFGEFLYGSEDRRERARKLLSDFNQQALRAWRGRRP